MICDIGLGGQNDIVLIFIARNALARERERECVCVCWYGKESKKGRKNESG